MKPAVFATTLFLTVSLSLSSLSAQTPTSAPSIRDTVKQKVDQQLSQIKNSSSKKAYLGSITTKSDLTLTLVSLKNLTRSVTILPETVIKLKGNADGTFKDLAVGDYVLTMGDADASGNLTAKRLVVVGKPADDHRQPVLGTVTAFTSKSLSLKTLTGVAWIANISSATKFTPTPTKFRDIDPGYRIVVIGTPVTGRENTLNALLVHVVAAPSPTPKPNL